MEDELYNEIIMVLKDSTILGFGANDEKKYRGIRKFYTFRETTDGKITLIKNVIDKLRIVPRRRELPAIFYKYHDESGHESKNVLMRETMIGYFWPTKTVDIDAYINNCEYCNDFKKRFNRAPSKKDRSIVLEETKGIIVPKKPHKRKSKESAASSSSSSSSSKTKTKSTKTKSSKITEEGPWGSVLNKKNNDSDNDSEDIDEDSEYDNDDNDYSSNDDESTSGSKRLKSSKNDEDNHDEDEDEQQQDNDNDNNNNNNNEEEKFKPKRLGRGRRQSTLSSISDDSSEIIF
ncbi:hypothetical protein ACTFIU_006646 [Dictyostelium citrinum]